MVIVFFVLIIIISTLLSGPQEIQQNQQTDPSALLCRIYLGTVRSWGISGGVQCNAAGLPTMIGCWRRGILHTSLWCCRKLAPTLGTRTTVLCLKQEYSTISQNCRVSNNHVHSWHCCVWVSEVFRLVLFLRHWLIVNQNVQKNVSKLGINRRKSYQKWIKTWKCAVAICLLQN